MPERTLPRPEQLAGLGAVLCQFRTGYGGELGGWARAVRAATSTSVDSDCVRERLVFFDADGRPCWQLHLLPDTDFLAWEQVCAALPAYQEESAANIATRLWRRLADREPWQLDAMHLHVMPPAPGFASIGVLAASPAPLSPLSAEAARRIARREGIEARRLIDDCCCRRAAPASTPTNPADPYPSIRFKRSEPA